MSQIEWEDRKINLIEHSTHVDTFEPTKSIFNIKKLSFFYINHSATSVVPTGKGTAWISSFHSNKIDLYDIRGKRISEITLTEGVLDLAVKQTGDIIVCNRDNKVRLVTVGGTETILFNTAHYRPQCVCLTKTEEIMVCMANKDNDNHVAVCSPNG